MPYKIEKSGSGWFVVNKDTHKRKNKSPHPSKAAAEQHMKALYAATANESFDAAILHYLSEMDSTQNSSNPLGATTTGKFTSTTAPAAQNSTAPVNVDLTTLDDKNIAHIKDVCTKMGKPYNSASHNEVALMIQNAKKQKATKPQPVATTNLTQPVQQPQQPATASAAPSTSYSSPQAAI